ncbi:trypsin-like serine peptidase [Nonomuraea roseoviolacea]|uniref:V8-like Glu-specific endopeptidase n=1 Tax=Nonomuraea roseoviolacea subsp. carminata TaxID=160689 RepID=A0ABT1JTN6_9ACTN|nr:peptidase [Nonomuraea roseoviolacea]MCP2345118.1 V8-like Glu-specific endopeptidase [Nonomuraea roseoviolacea subsp. carminata]
MHRRVALLSAVTRRALAPLSAVTHRRLAALSAVTLAATAVTALAAAGPAQAGSRPGSGTGAGSSAGFGAAAEPGPVRWSATDSSSERTSVLRYWTSQRMLAARPYDTPTPRRATGFDQPTQGTPWATRGASAALPQRAPLRVTTVAAHRPAEVVANSTGLRWVDGGGVVRTVGRVFFTTAGGGNASCSGTAVTSANKSVVMTAGHCVKMGGAFHRNWVFVPGFDNGRRPLGTWVATRLLTTAQWNAREDINFDVGAAVVAPLQGRTLVDVAGGQGVAFNQPRQRQTFAFGYPAAAPFDGSALIYCSGRSFNDTVMTQDQGLACRMTGGSSGGPWFRGFDGSTGLGWLNSVNSFKYNFAPNVMMGPFFGNEAQALYQAAQTTNAL